MTIMKKALYAHVAKNPTHINTGIIEDGETMAELEPSPRVPSLRVRKHDSYKIEDEMPKELPEETYIPEPSAPVPVEEAQPRKFADATHKKVVVPLVIKKKPINWWLLTYPLIRLSKNACAIHKNVPMHKWLMNYLSNKARVVQADRGHNRSWTKWRSQTKVNVHMHT